MSQADPDFIVSTVLPGGSGLQAVEDSLKACASQHSGTSRPSYAVAGMLWYDTSAGKVYLYDGTNDIEVTLGGKADEDTFTANDATPDVSSLATVFKTANTTATTITGFDNGTAGQVLVVLCNDAYTTLDSGLTHSGRSEAMSVGDVAAWVYDGTGWQQFAGTVGMRPVFDLPSLTAGDTTPSVAGLSAAKTNNSSATTITALDDGEAGQVFTLVVADANTTIDGGLTKTGMTIPLQSGDVLQWVYDGSSWQQIAGTVGMGTCYVKLTNQDIIGDWISSSTTSWTDVNVSDDGVRKGAVLVELNGRFNGDSAPYIALQTRPNGSTDGSDRYVIIRVTDQNTSAMWSIALDENGVFEAMFDVSWTPATNGNQVYVSGYWI